MPRKPKAEFEITADNKSKRAFREINTDLKQLGNVAVKATQVIAAAATAVGALAVKMAADFDKSITEVGALLDNVTQGEMQAMKKQVQAIGIEFGQARNVSTKALFDITSAGFKGAQGMKVLREAAKLAVAGVTDISNTADLITSALNAYKLEAEEAKRVSDIFFATQRVGKTTIQELASSIGEVLPVAKLMGVSLEEVGGALATLTLSGTGIREATTQLNQFFLSLLKPSEEMKKLGITARDTSGKLLPFVQIVKQFEGIDPQVLAKLVPNIRAFKGVATLSGSFKSLKENINAVEDASGATDKAFKLLSDAGSARISRVSEAFKVLLESIGDVISESDEFKIVTTEFENLFRDFATAINDNREELTKWVNFIIKGFRAGVQTGINTLDVFRAEFHLLNAAIFKTIQLVLLSAKGWAFLTDALEITDGAVEEITKAMKEVGDIALGAFESAVDILTDMKVITGEAAEETKKQANIQKDLNTELKETKKLVEDLGPLVSFGGDSPAVDSKIIKRREKFFEAFKNPLKKFKQDQADLFATLPDAFGGVDLSTTRTPQEFEALIEQADRLGTSINFLAVAQKNADLSQAAGLNTDQQFGDISSAERKALNELVEDQARVTQLLLDPLDEAARLENILDDRLRAGAITTLEHADAVKRLHEEFGLIPASADPMLAALDRIASGLESNLTDALFDATKGVDSMGDSFKRMVDLVIKEVIRLQVVQPILKGLFGESGSGGGLIGLGLSGGLSLFSGGGPSAANPVATNTGELFGPGFAHGGSFMVGGGGGTDKTPVGFMATRGERVIVQTPQQQKQGGVVINMDLRGSNGDASIQAAVIRGIRKAAPQLVGASVRAVRDGRQRDPNFFG